MEQKKQQEKKKGFLSRVLGRKKPKESNPVLGKKPGQKPENKIPQKLQKPFVKKKASENKLSLSKKPAQKQLQKAQVKAGDTVPVKKAVPKKPKLKQKHFMPGIPGLNKLFTNGIPSGAAVLVEGGPGSGKTIFCLQSCVDACRKGIKTLFMSFEEPEYRLREHLREFNFNPEEYEKKGILKIKRFNALDIARSVEALLSEAKKELLIEIQPVLIPQDFEPDVIFIDSLTSISSAFSGETSRFRIYMEQLFRYLESNRITSFLIRETPNPTHIGMSISGGEAVSFLSDGIIIIYNVFHKSGERGRAVEILKMRGEAINRKIVEMDILSGKGMVVFPDKVLKGEYTLT